MHLTKDNTQGQLGAQLNSTDTSLIFQTGHGSRFSVPNTSPSRYTWSGATTSAGTSELLNHVGILALGKLEVGDTLYNLSDGSDGKYSSCSIITINTDSVITTKLHGGSANTWGSGDTWCIFPSIFTVTSRQDGLATGEILTMEKIYVKKIDGDVVNIHARGLGVTLPTTFALNDFVDIFVVSQTQEDQRDYISYLDREKVSINENRDITLNGTTNITGTVDAQGGGTILADDPTAQQEVVTKQFFDDNNTATLKECCEDIDGATSPKIIAVGFDLGAEESIHAQTITSSGIAITTTSYEYFRELTISSKSFKNIRLNIGLRKFVGNPTGTLNFEIWRTMYDQSAAPSKIDIDAPYFSDSIDISTISTSETYYDFDFGGSEEMDNTFYTIKIYPSSAFLDGSNYIRFYDFEIFGQPCNENELKCCIADSDFKHRSNVLGVGKVNKSTGEQMPILPKTTFQIPSFSTDFYNKEALFLNGNLIKDIYSENRKIYLGTLFGGDYINFGNNSSEIVSEIQPPSFIKYRKLNFNFTEQDYPIYTDDIYKYCVLGSTHAGHDFAYVDLRRKISKEIALPESTIVWYGYAIIKNNLFVRFRSSGINKTYRYDLPNLTNETDVTTSSNTYESYMLCNGLYFFNTNDNGSQNDNTKLRVETIDRSGDPVTFGSGVTHTTAVRILSTSPVNLRTIGHNYISDLSLRYSYGNDNGGMCVGGQIVYGIGSYDLNERNYYLSSF